MDGSKHLNKNLISSVAIYYSIHFGLIVCLLEGPRHLMHADGITVWTLINLVGKNFQVPLKNLHLQIYGEGKSVDAIYHG